MVSPLSWFIKHFKKDDIEYLRYMHGSNFFKHKNTIYSVKRNQPNSFIVQISGTTIQQSIEAKTPREALEEYLKIKE